MSIVHGKSMPKFWMLRIHARRPCTCRWHLRWKALEHLRLLPRLRYRQCPRQRSSASSSAENEMEVIVEASASIRFSSSNDKKGKRKQVSMDKFLSPPTKKKV